LSGKEVTLIKVQTHVKRLLISMPGIGRLITLIIFAEIGDIN
jgi:transposase